METRRIILRDSKLRFTELYSPVVVQKGHEVGLQVLHTRYQIKEDNGLSMLSETYWLEPTPQNINRILDCCEKDFILLTIDPYLRYKLAGTPIYESLYSVDSKSTLNMYQTDISKKLDNVLTNLILLPVKSLLYLYNLTMFAPHNKETNPFLDALYECKFRPANKNRNARKNLGISKAKETIIKRYGFSFLFGFENEVFDDDMEFLLHITDGDNFDSKKTLEQILCIKSYNKSLKYEDIIRRASKIFIDNSYYTYVYQALIDMRKQCELHGALVGDDIAKHHPKFSSSLSYSFGDYRPKGIVDPPPFEIDGWDVYSIPYTSCLAYINNLCKAVTDQYLQQTIQQGHVFFAAMRKGRVALVEYHNGTVLNIKQHGKDLALSVTERCKTEPF